MKVLFFVKGVRGFLTSINKDIPHLRHFTAAKSVRIGTELLNCFDRPYEPEAFTRIDGKPALKRALYEENQSCFLVDDPALPDFGWMRCPFG